MKILCPRCDKTHNTRPDDLMGRFFICQNCRFIFMWEKKSDALKNRKPSPAQDPGLKEIEKGNSGPVTAREL